MHRLVLGPIILKITCADCAVLLNQINAQGIVAKDITYHSSIEFTITVGGRDYFQLRQLVVKQGGTIQIRRFSRIYQYLCGIKKHPVILSFLCLLTILTAYVPRRIFFISVVGNDAVPTNKIIEASADCGLQFGAVRRTIRSEVIKNHLLMDIPELQWVGVNTTGCTATISVREKTIQNTKEIPQNQVSSIIANRDGIIQNFTVYQGTPLCAIGQAVKAGQTLVSGYTDCGLITKATKAEAEITAITYRNLEIVTPNAAIKRSKEYTKHVRYALRIGKKLINLSKDSGNFDTSCAKIYTEKFVHLPGGFRLPISVVKTTIFRYDTQEQGTDASDVSLWLEDFSISYLNSTMIAGQVISSQLDVVNGDHFSCLRGKYVCLEMIGQVKYEQKLLRN